MLLAWTFLKHVDRKNQKISVPPLRELPLCNFEGSLVTVVGEIWGQIAVFGAKVS